MSWADLREIRRQGLRPSLPVVIVSGPAPMRLLREEGCLLIEHKPGESFHAELLEDLRVWLFLGNCNRAQAVVCAMNIRGVQPRELNAWCECGKRFDSRPVC